MIKGGKLKVKELHGLLHSSYDPKDEVEGFILDKSLSSKTSKVYYNPENHQSVVAHRGTEGFSDWFNNAVYAYGGKNYYQYTPRYREAKSVQEKAQRKYGADNITTIGHSQGGLQAEMLGTTGKEIITLNKATRPFSNTKSSKQFDVRADIDIVSSLNPIQSKNGNEIIIPAKNIGRLDAHSIDILQKLEGDREIGLGLKFHLKSGGVSRRNGLTDLDLVKLLKHDKKFIGKVYMKDELPDKLEKNKWYIINMQNSYDGHGTHWVCFKTSNPMIYFDPIIGGDPPLEVLQYAIKTGIEYKMLEIENISSTACGWFCVACILSDKGSGSSLIHFKRFLSHFSKDTARNDLILHNMLVQLGAI
jgi:hypothetical protein